MHTKKTYLKIKILSLGAEALLIKKEERKWLKVPFFHENVKHPHPLYLGLRGHRLYEVRTECRHAHIAYGWMRGRRYKQIENKCHIEPDWSRVANIVNVFSYGRYAMAPDRKALKEQLEAWSRV